MAYKAAPAFLQSSPDAAMIFFCPEGEPTHLVLPLTHSLSPKKIAKSDITR